MKYTLYSHGNKKICAGKNEEKMKGEEGKREKGKKRKKEGKRRGKRGKGKNREKEEKR